MASPKRPTRAQMEKMLEKMQADMEVLKRKSEILDTTMRPVLYLMRAGQDAATYIVGNAESLKTMPAALIGADGETDADADSESIYYKMLEVGENAASLAAELERCLAPFKAGAGVGTGESYAVSFEEGKMWLDFVVGRAMLEGMTDAALRQECLRRLVKIFASIKRANAAVSAETAEDAAVGAGAEDDDAVSGSVKKTKEAKIAEEHAKIASFVKERCILDENAPLIKKNEVLCVYRIWAKGTSSYSNSSLVEYMRDKMGVHTVNIGPATDGVVAFKGLMLKMSDWKYDLSGNAPVKRFLREKCTFSPTARTFSRTIQEAYIKWRAESGLLALELTDLRREVRDELRVCPILHGASITIGEDAAAGWYGILLNGEVEPDASTPTPTRKLTFKAGKALERRMPGEGGKVLESWPSVTKAAKALNIPAHKIQILIRKAQPDEEGAILAFAPQEAGGAGASGGSSEKGE